MKLNLARETIWYAKDGTPMLKEAKYYDLSAKRPNGKFRKVYATWHFIDGKWTHRLPKECSPKLAAIRESRIRKRKFIIEAKECMAAQQKGHGDDK